MRRLYSLGLVLFCASALAGAAPSGKRLHIALSSSSPSSAPALYRIELADGRTIPSLGLPSSQGSVVVYRTADGALTSVPREMVVRIVGEGAPASGVEPAADALVSGEAESPAAVELMEAPAPLQPGDLVVLGRTGGDENFATPAESAVPAGPAPGAPGVGAVGYGGGSVGVGGYGGATAVNPALTTVGPDGMLRVLSSTDLTRAISPTTTIDANGFPATSTSPTVIGPNGTPTLAPGFGGAAPAIGANGTPVVAGSASPVIGPNGTPVVAGSSSPVIGPNGTPVLAAPGQPGSAAPVIGPNGTPAVGGAAAPSVGPNGFPAAPPPGKH